MRCPTRHSEKANAVRMRVAERETNFVHAGRCGSLDVSQEGATHGLETCSSSARRLIRFAHVDKAKLTVS
jgi:hypothetical protein